MNGPLPCRRASAGTGWLLHFGAVDQCCRVLVNDRPVGGHQGGYLPFALDITGALAPGENRLTVAVTDDPEGGVHAFGKQRTDRGGIWYTAQSGIWQTVCWRVQRTTTSVPCA